MDVCRNHLNDKELAKRVDDLLHVGRNYDLIGHSFNDRLVPNMYSPEPGVMIEILKQVDINGALELIPRLWSDIVIFDLANREDILEMILNIMVANKPNIDIATQSNLGANFSNIAWEIFKKIEGQSENRTNPLRWSGTMISNSLALTCRSDDYVKALQIFDKINQNQDAISGVADPSALKAFIKLSIASKRPTKAIAALQYCVENSFSNNQALGRLIVDSMTLDDQHISKITSLVGTEVLKG